MVRGIVSAMLVTALALPVFAEKKKVAAANEDERAPARKEKSQPLLDRMNDNVSGQGYGMAGCGLGSVVLGDKPGMIQIFGATLNSTSGNQTFGMTSGTSNCDSYKDMASIQFIDSNLYSLENDAARGGGESLQSLSQLMNCDISGAKVQSHYTNIFDGTNDARKIYFSIRQNLNCQG